MIAANQARAPTPRGRPGQPKPRVDRDARAQAVLDAAVMVFAEKGLNAATMQDIADRVCMAKILIYRLYPSRQALIDALFSDILTAIETIAAEPWGGYGSGMAALIELGRARPALFLLLLREARGGPETLPWATACDALLSGLTEPFVAAPGIERNDGMTDAARIKWFGDMVRAWRMATREALGLPDAPEPAVLASRPPRGS
ncbi:MAG: TetR family transcriptional regulator [Caulobacter sp. 32-67-35]|nr:MAG: TetR family transcriptional regulator [Caulobacter sp. 32-67-35]